VGSKNGATDLHELRERGAILILRHQQPICATISTSDELTRLGRLRAHRQSESRRLSHRPAYDASTRATMIFNDECKVVGDPARDERLAVSALPPA
jgi:carboxylesterase type B